jgi:RimJ/RimL family protein N-acetyltransferase
VEVVGLKGERVRLVPPDRRLHLENAYRWMNDPEVTANLALNLGVTHGQEVAYFDRIEARSDNEYIWAIVEQSGRHVGFIGLHAIDWRHRSAIGGIVIGEREVWGRGIATEAVGLRSRFAFEQIPLHRIEGMTWNPAMRKVYEKCGYRHEGVARKKRWRNGGWQDVDLFALLDEDYFSAAALRRD